MRELVTSLLRVEELARDLYASAARYFIDDPDFALFLSSLAKDEALHANAMRRAVELVDGMPHQPVQAFELAGKRLPSAGDRVRDALEKMRGGALDKREMIGCVLDLEMSEWNDFFLYVVDVLKGQDREFQHMASDMQAHIEDVLRVCRAFRDDSTSSHPLNEAPSVWTRRTLVVDDEPAITNMLTRVLRNNTTVEMAQDGKQALEKLRENFYDAVISDVDMPVSNGLQLLQDASKIDLGIRERFLFLTAKLSEEHLRFLTDNNIAFLYKPASVVEIRNALDRILNRKEDRLPQDPTLESDGA